MPNPSPVQRTVLYAQPRRPMAMSSSYSRRGRPFDSDAHGYHFHSSSSASSHPSRRDRYRHSSPQRQPPHHQYHPRPHHQTQPQLSQQQHRRDAGRVEKWEHDLYDAAASTGPASSSSHSRRYFGNGRESHPPRPGHRFQGGGIGGGRPLRDSFEPDRDRGHTFGRDLLSGKKLIVENLHWNVTERDLKELFRPYKLQSARIIYDSTDRSTGRAELAFETPRDAGSAILQYDNVELDGQPMKITKWRNMPPRRDERRMGGRGRGGGATFDRRGRNDGFHPYRRDARGEWGRHEGFGRRENGRPRGSRHRTEEGGKKTQAELDKELQAYIDSAPPEVKHQDADTKRDGATGAEREGQAASRSTAGDAEAGDTTMVGVEAVNPDQPTGDGAGAGIGGREASAQGKQEHSEMDAD